MIIYSLVLQATEEKNNDLLFIIIVFSALLGAMTSVFFFNCIRKLIRDQKIIRVSVRQVLLQHLT